jgi:hypothetical protein
MRAAEAKGYLTPRRAAIRSQPLAGWLGKTVGIISIIYLTEFIIWLTETQRVDEGPSGSVTLILGAISICSVGPHLVGRHLLYLGLVLNWLRRH